MYDNKFHGMWHAYVRAEERMECDMKKADRIFARALERGKRYNDYEFKKSRSYLQKKSMSGTFAVAFSNFIFIFDKDTEMCITCFKAPQWFGQKKPVKARPPIDMGEYDYAA